MVVSLLPLEHEAPACTAFTRDLGVSPAGSGLSVDRLVVVAAAGPWPKPALSHPTLKPLVAPLTASAASTRLLAGEPTAGASDIEVYERSGLGATRTCFDFTGPASVLGEPSPQRAAWYLSVIEQIATTPLGALGATAHANATAAFTLAEHGELATPVMLVCTQGSHDNCCGVYGESLVALIERDQPGVAVRGVSHTGGHRFAPTAMALPRGRMWAWIDEPLLERIVAETPTADDLAQRCRGWWGARAGAAQAAELAARIDHVREFDHAPTIAPLAERDDGAPREFAVTAGSSTWIIEVAVARRVPTIACEQLGGLPSKQSTEYGWSVVHKPNDDKGLELGNHE